MTNLLFCVGGGRGPARQRAQRVPAGVTGPVMPRDPAPSQRAADPRSGRSRSVRNPRRGLGLRVRRWFVHRLPPFGGTAVRVRCERSGWPVRRRGARWCICSPRSSGAARAGWLGRPRASPPSFPWCASGGGRALLPCLGGTLPSAGPGIQATRRGPRVYGGRRGGPSSGHGPRRRRVGSGRPSSPGVAVGHPPWPLARVRSASATLPSGIPCGPG